MSATKIARLEEMPTFAADAPDTMAELDRDLYARASAELGYTHSATVVQANNNVRERAAAARDLYQKLFDAGIKPLNPKAVARYKLRLRALQWVKPFIGTLAMMAFAGVVWWLAGVFPFPAKAGPVMQFFAGAAIVGLVVSGIIAVLPGILFLWINFRPTDWHWQRVSLPRYDRAVPPYAIALALQVKRLARLPNAAWGGPGTFQFAVDEFRVNERERHLDPFLVVIDCYGNEAYLAAWDEPSFRDE